MSSLSVNTHVAAPIADVFQVFTQLDKAQERIPTITNLEILSEGPFGVGTRWRETRLIMKKESTEEMRVTGHNPPHNYTVEAQSLGMLYETLFQFEPQSEGTKVTWEFRGTPQTWFNKILAPLISFPMAGLMKKCMQADLEVLRAVCEQG